MTQTKPNKLFLFYILVAYIIFQFIWWEILLVKQTREIHSEQQKLTELASTNETILKQNIAELNKQENKRIYMVVGEGTVFLIFITLGILKVYRTYKRDTELAIQQRNFLLSITHELKSPIASAKLQLQTLQKRELERETQQQLISNALHDTERLNNLVENILMSAQLEVKDDLLHKENLNVSQLINEIVQNHVPKKILSRVVSHIQPDINIMADKIAFPSILINLIENAAKYSSEIDQIIISLSRKNQEIILSVADSGIGISDEEKNKVFEKFYRIGNEETRNTKGTGLGLFIVKRLVDQHNGKISIQNNQPNGTVFVISFTEVVRGL